MKIQNSLILASILLLIGCKTGKNSANKSQLEVITISPSSNKEIALSDIIEEIEIIQLETNTNNYISDIDKIRFYNNKIYLFEKFGSQKFLCFDINGKFQSKIGSVGKAEGEYITPRDFNINPWHNRIELYDITSNKILYYDMKGEYIGHYALNKKLRAFTIIDSLNYGCFNDGEYEDTPYNFFTTSSESFEVKNLNLKFQGQRDIMNGVNPFYEYQNNILFAYSLNNTIYKVTKNGIQPRYTINYEAAEIPSDILNKDMQTIVNYLIVNKVPGFISRLGETELHLTFSYSYDSLKNNTVFYNKFSKQLVNIYKPINDINYIPFHPPISTVENKFVSAVPAYEVIQKFNELTKLKSSNPDMVNARAFEEIKKIALNIREDDNPILMLYKINDYR